MVGATVFLLLALAWGGRQHAWDSPVILGLFSASVVLGALFLAWQKRASEPLLPISILRNRIIVVTSIGAILITMVNMALSIYLPLYLQLCRAKTVGQAGVLLTAPLFGVVLGSYLSGQYMRFTGRYKLSPLVGLAVATAAFLVLAVAAGTLALAAVVGLSFLLGVGIGASLPPMMVASQNSVPAGDIGIATAVHTFSARWAGRSAWPFSARWCCMLGPLGSQLETAHAAQGTVAGDAAAQEAVHAFSVFFGACALTLALAWAALTRLPVIPFRKTAARFERAEPESGVQADAG